MRTSNMLWQSVPHMHVVHRPGRLGQRRLRDVYYGGQSEMSTDS